MKKGGKYPGLLRHVLQAIGEKRSGLGAGSTAVSKVEKIIKKAVAKRSVNPAKDIYSMRRRRKKDKDPEKRRKKRRRSHSKDATSAYSDGADSFLEDSESDSEKSRSRSRSRSKSPEPSEKSSKRRSKRKEEGGKRKKRRRHRE